MEHLDAEWERGDDDGILTINRGIHGVVRLIDDIVNHLLDGGIDPKSSKPDSIITDVKYYLDPLITFISSITPELRKELRDNRGAPADTKFWRTFQKAVADARNDFCPGGLNEYWEDESKLFNEESSRFLMQIEKHLKELVCFHLNEKHGDNWLILGLPKGVYDRASLEKAENEREVILSGGDADSSTTWDYISFADLKQIVTYGRNWSELFDKLLTRDEERSIYRDKEQRTGWITRLNTLQTKLKNPLNSISKDEYGFISNVKHWLFEMD